MTSASGRCRLCDAADASPAWAMVGTGKAARAKPDAPEAEPHFPLLLVVATIVGAGLQCLFSLRRRNEGFS